MLQTMKDSEEEESYKTQKLSQEGFASTWSEKFDLQI